MAMEPFTPTGLEDKLEDLYALGDSELMTEAAQVAEDFVAWMEGNFILDTSQTAYLTGMQDNVRKVMGYLYVGAILTRGDITMTALPNNPPPRRIKEKRENVKALLIYDDGTKNLAGSIDVDMDWALLEIA